MSRSFKKTPIIKDNGEGKKWQKNQANRRFRRLKSDEFGATIADGNAYQKVYNSWMITDYKSRMTKEEATRDYYSMCKPKYYARPWTTPEIWEQMANDFKKRYPALEDYLKWWSKSYRRK